MVFIQVHSFKICNMLSSFSSNFILKNTSLEIFTYLWSAIAIVSFLKFSKIVGPLEKKTFSVPWELKYKRITIIRPQNLIFTHSELFNDIWLIRIQHMVEEQYQIFNLMHIVFEHTLIKLMR